MTLLQIDEIDINDYSKIIHCLKNGCFLTEFGKEKPKRVILENTGGFDGYQFRSFPHNEFEILREFGFIWEESGNWETGESHYIWDIWDCHLHDRPLRIQQIKE